MYSQTGFLEEAIIGGNEKVKEVRSRSIPIFGLNVSLDVEHSLGNVNLRLNYFSRRYCNTRNKNDKIGSTSFMEHS